MDYKKIYKSIIERGKNRKLEGYTESHHIIPRCMGGTDEKSNLVNLTAKEHYLAHRLLMEIHPEEPKLIYAFWMMSTRFSLSSRAYADCREFMSKNMRKNVGTPEAIAKMAKSKKGQQSWLGKKHKESSKKKMRKAKVGKKPSKESIEKMRQSKIGVEFTEEHKKNMSKAKTGDKNPMYGKTGKQHHNSKPINQYDLEGNFIKEWPGTREAGRALKLSSGAIHNALNSKTHRSQGFMWKRKKIM